MFAGQEVRMHELLPFATFFTLEPTPLQPPVEIRHHIDRSDRDGCRQRRDSA
ncbi:hypothetical protein D3C78_1604560 [compost metagenome]